MAQSIEAKKVMYGSDGEVWVDGDYMAEVEACKATITYDKIEIKMVKHKGHGYKNTGWTGKGSVKFHHVDSYFVKKYAASAKEGRQVPVTIISKMSDPDAVGEERIALKNVLFDSFDLVNWEVGKPCEDSYNFTFDDYEVLDTAG